MPLRLLSRKGKQPAAIAAADIAKRTKPPEVYVPADAIALESDELRRFVQLGRFGVVAANPDRWRGHREVRAALQAANEAIDADFALVPEGCAAVPLTVNDTPGMPERETETQPFLLARHAVTNGEFQNFVDSGAYDDLDLWPEDIWPHLIDFRDLTDQPAPRFWRNGRHNKRRSDHPVVGICFYEAQAYSAWAGYRLCTEEEWQVAASWRIRSSAYVLRRYPWGDALDTARCNIWGSGVATTMPVDTYENGAAPNGVRQLVGNVWEWTDSEFDITDEEERPIVGDMVMMSVRGGAFDTYFPSQATSCFRTGVASLIRAHNVGFRCALDLRE
jgi:iron(II)-dependent oxidoreductase